MRFLAEPSDEVALVAILRSPFFAVDDPTLHELARQREEGASWWEVMREGSGERISRARAILQQLLRVRHFEPPAALLRLADRFTGYTAIIANLPGAPRREADWRGFCDLVDALGFGTEDVFSVVRSLRQMLEAGAAASRPPLEAADAVSLLTIHSAKGLEWPVVVVPDLSRQFPSSSNPVLFDSEFGVAVDFGEEEGGEGVLYRILKNRKESDREAEARRVFYVAPTRARDHLILTSTEETTNRLCGLTLLRPGLDMAGIDCVPVPFRPEESEPPELPTPSPEIPVRVLLGAGRLTTAGLQRTCPHRPQGAGSRRFRVAAIRCQYNQISPEVGDTQPLGATLESKCARRREIYFSPLQTSGASRTTSFLNQWVKKSG